MNKIITIAREFGSGGRELGRCLAEKLQIAYYDREILSEISQRTSFTEDYIQQVVERQPTAPMTLGLSRGLVSQNAPALPQNQAIYQEQASIIREMAERSDCVLVGRCADYILREKKPLRLFVCAEMASRIARCRLVEDEYAKLSDKELKAKILNVDRHRARYYEFYTGQTWGDRLNYDLTVNTTNTSIPEIAGLIAKLFD